MKPAKPAGEREKHRRSYTIPWDTIAYSLELPNSKIGLDGRSLPKKTHLPVRRVLSAADANQPR